MSVHVLIADDAGFVRELLIQACEAMGYVVVGEARDGNEAIELALTLKPDVVIMDLVMPHFNGLEATQKILEHLPETAVIACSSLDDENTLNLALKTGCKAFLRKPFNRSSIDSVFRQLDLSPSQGVKHG
jgi:two-component system, chemotaxis family, chemotaxis protein CheY